MIVRCPNCHAVMVSCDRCRRPALLSAEELAGDGGGDPEFPVLPRLMLSWIHLPEEGLLCADCSSPAEITEWMARNVRIEAILSGDDQVPPDP